MLQKYWVLLLLDRHTLETSCPAVDSSNKVGKIEGQLLIQDQLLWVLCFIRESVKEQLMNRICFNHGGGEGFQPASTSVMGYFYCCSTEAD